MSALLELTQNLISQPSVTPGDAGCQAILCTHLTKLGFETTMLPNDKVTNLWARYGSQAPLLVFAGHTDVVPAGDVAAWNSPPFTPTIKDGYLYGRGAADMKASVAAMITSCAKFTQQYPDFTGSIGFLITSGEEGDYFEQGTPFVMQN